MAGYTPLFSSIVRSSIWDEDKATRIVWITLLALAEADGVVQGSVKGLAHEARVSVTECGTALAILNAPDEYSRSKDDEGRRIKEVEGGWLILNHKKYREKAKSRAEYYRHWKKEKKQKKEELTTLNVDVDVYSNSATARNRRNSAQQGATVAQQEEKTTTSSSPKETKSHKGNRSDRILSAWQKLPLPPEKKQFTAADILAIERAISILAGDSQEPIHEGMILEAIENYRQALMLPDSQTYKHKLYNWLMEHVRKYTSYAFDIEKHHRCNFDKKGKTDVGVEMERLKAKGEL